MVYDREWRLKIGKRHFKGEFKWRFNLHTEYIEFAEEMFDIADFYNWNYWGGGVDNYAVTLSQMKPNGKSISIKMISSDNYYYYASFVNEINPNNIEVDSYKQFVGKTIDDVIDYVQEFLENNDYKPDDVRELICIEGGAYDRYLLAKKWALEELEEEKKLIGV